MIALAAAGAVYLWSGAKLVDDPSALAQVELQPFAGSIARIRAAGPGGAAIPLAVHGRPPDAEAHARRPASRSRSRSSCGGRAGRRGRSGRSGTRRSRSARRSRTCGSGGSPSRRASRPAFGSTRRSARVSLGHGRVAATGNVGERAGTSAGGLGRGRRRGADVGAARCAREGDVVPAGERAGRPREPCAAARRSTRSRRFGSRSRSRSRDAIGSTRPTLSPSVPGHWVERTAIRSSSVRPRSARRLRALCACGSRARWRSPAQGRRPHDLLAGRARVVPAAAAAPCRGGLSAARVVADARRGRAHAERAARGGGRRAGQGRSRGATRTRRPSCSSSGSSASRTRSSAAP